MSRIRDIANLFSANTDAATDAEVTSSIASHAAAADPHTGYVLESLYDAKGDLIVGSADNTPSKLTSGNNGETLVADSSTSTGLRYQGSMAAGRNFVTNGGMDIWQRATSALDGQNTYKTADRWLLSLATAVTFSRQLTGDTTNLPFIQYCMRLQRTAGSTNTNNMNIAQSFETVNSIPLAGKTVTLSLYARKGANYSATSSDIAVQLFTGTGTDQNVYTAGYTGSVGAINQSAVLTTTWQRFTYSATLASNTTEIGLIIIGAPTGTAGAADYYEVTGIQLEVGSVATQFTRQGGTIAGELAACQRYFSTSYQNGVAVPTAGGSGGLGVMFSYPANALAGHKLGAIYYPVRMRANPTVTIYSYTSATSNVVSDATGSDLAANTGTPYLISAYSFYVHNNTANTIYHSQGGYICHFAASAEL